MDELTFTQFKKRNTGKTSLTKCSLHELDLLVKALKAKGFVPRRSGAKKSRPLPFKLPEDKAGLIRKIRAQLDEGNYPELYAQQILGNMRKKAGKPQGPMEGNYVSNPLEMATPEELGKVIAALYYNAKRKGLKTR